MFKQEKIMRISIVVMAVITALILIMASIQVFFKKAVDYTNWITVGVFAVFCVVQILCIFNQKFSIRKFGFYFLHVGLVLFLIGSFMYFVKGDTINTVIPVDKKTYSSINRNGEPYDLGFNIKLNSFKVEKYPAVYDIYIKDTNDSGENWKKKQSDIENIDGYFDFGEYGKIKETQLQENGVFKEQFLLSQNVMITKREPNKHYEAEMVLNNEKGERTVNLMVNHPARSNGWKIYLMNYNQEENLTTISVLLKYDPGEFVTLTGIWLIIIGAFVMCLFKGKKAGDKK